MTTSDLIPLLSGSRAMRSGSVPAMQAAVVSTRPEAALAVTYAASTSSRPAMRSPTFSCSSSSMQNFLPPASRITSNNPGSIRDPP